MRQFLSTLYATIHVLIRGGSVVESTLTPLEYKYRYLMDLGNGKDRFMVFRCRQHRHYVRYHRWYMRNRVYYTYSVEMINMDGTSFIDHHVCHYPHLCMGWLANTTYPHQCAINAHIDALMHCNGTA